jgi:hypothetical protein
MRDLGVIIDEKLTFNDQCSLVQQKCGTVINCLLRSFNISNTVFLTNLFKVFVRPIAEYCSTVFNPHTSKNIEELESIQHNFTKRILYKSDASYPERLKILGLETLEVRRGKRDLEMAFKIIFMKFGIPLEELFDLSANHIVIQLRSKGLACAPKPILRTDKLHLDCRKFFFSNRIVEVWNRLTRGAILASNPKAFAIQMAEEYISASKPGCPL